jgi:thiol:disulfide interchange protein DsbC
MALKPFIISMLFFLFLVFPLHPVTHNLSTTVDAFSEGGCDPDCKKCHSLNNQEAGNILKKMNLSHAKITGIQISPAKGLWEISIDDKGQRGVFYVDFAKKHIIVGNIIEIDTGSNKTLSQVKKTQNKKIAISNIPLENALIMGNKKASKKVVVFTDPD